MKKYITFVTTALVILLSSCENDPIEISQAVSFTVNPATVIEPFSEVELEAGELESFSTTHKLRIRLLVYDKEGILVNQISGTYSNYAVKMRENLFLDEGNYTAVAISDIYRPSDNFEFWAISGEKQLSTLKITDTGYFGGSRSVLGITKKTFSVNEKDINIDIKPVGSLFLVYYKGIFTFSDVISYQLSVNKLQESLAFDNRGEYSVNVKNNNGSYDWRISKVDLEDWSSTQTKNVYDFAYQLPMNNVGLCFAYETESSVNLFNTRTTVNLNAGDGYLCLLDLKDDDDGKIHCYYEKVSSASGNKVKPFGYTVARHIEYPADIKRNDATVGQYVYPKDLK